MKKMSFSLLKELALFVRDDDPDGIAVAMQCELPGYTRISGWKSVQFNLIGEQNENTSNLDFDSFCIGC